MKITCIGSGAFSIAIANLLAKDKENEIMIWSHDEQWVKKAEKKGELKINETMTIKKADNMTLTTSYETAIEHSNIIFLLTSSKYFIEVINELKYYNMQKKTIFIGSKGMLSMSPYYLTSYAKKALKTKKIAYFAGPNFAQDLIQDAPVLISVASKKKKTYQLFNKLFHDNVKTQYLKNSEVLELASILKNIYAIGSGLIYGKNPYPSTNISYTSLAYQEMESIIKNLTNFQSIDAYAAIKGDFFLTNMMKESRNFRYGIQRQKSSADAANYLKKNTVEGYDNLENIVNYLGKQIKNFPILYTIYDIIYKNKETDTLTNICFQRT